MATYRYVRTLSVGMIIVVMRCFLLLVLFCCFCLFPAQAFKSVNSISGKLARVMNFEPDETFNGIDESVRLSSSPEHRVVMGESNDECDNGKDRLEVDWNGSPINYTCYLPKFPWTLDSSVESVISCDTIQEGYSPEHHCMSQTIHYDSILPTHEGHRPLWPIFGEYQFVPPQRWLHNIEHGAVVMLYHPCVEPCEVLRLKNLVKSCLWKYVITPSNMLSREKPLALVAWGCRLEMAFVDSLVVRYFIRNKALKGPEGNYTKQGQYSQGLIAKSWGPSEDPKKDQILC